jgi:hypothetical protein
MYLALDSSNGAWNGSRNQSLRISHRLKFTESKPTSSDPRLVTGRVYRDDLLFNRGSFFKLGICFSIGDLLLNWRSAFIFEIRYYIRDPLFEIRFPVRDAIFNS